MDPAEIAGATVEPLALQLGMVGLIVLFVLIVLGGVLYFLLKHLEKKEEAHKEERQEWRQEDRMKHEEMLNARKDTDVVITQLKDVIGMSIRSNSG